MPILYPHLTERALVYFTLFPGFMTGYHASGSLSESVNAVTLIADAQTQSEAGLQGFTSKLWHSKSQLRKHPIFELDHRQATNATYTFLTESKFEGYTTKALEDVEQSPHPSYPSKLANVGPF